jgi:drug/metabolite transporter (DMT)-like permease
MFPLALALISGLSWGTADFVGGLMTKRLAPATVLVIGQSAGLAFTAGLVVLLGEPMPEARYLVYGGLGGIAGAIGLASLYQGLAVGRMSIVAPTAALSGAVPVLAGFLQGDRPEPMQLVGMAVAGAGVLLATRAPEPVVATPGAAGPVVGDPEAAPGRGPAAGVGYALLAALFLGLLVTSLDAAGAGSPFWGTLMVRATSVPLFAVAWLFRGDRRRPTSADVGILVVVGLFDNAANVLFSLAARAGELSLVAVLGSLYPVATVLLARLVLHERLVRLQAVGVGAAFTGVALIAIGG